ncbi:MAG: hypoxanthine phosphoribosyltransferase [Candidatus Actinomarina sp.]
MEISKVLISQEEIENKVSELANEINSKYKGKELVVIGILKGAFIVVSDLAKQLDLDVTFDFMSIKSYYGSESTGQVKIVKDLEYDITDKNVLIVEDIYDTGLTLSNLKKLLESRNPKSIEVFSMFVKKEVAQDPIEINYSGFEIGPEFVVGYGLDYNGKYRELPYLAVLA